ncbi:carcinine transporter-like [Achroia grisella]|uniref:carcinine transporter-like n=1 Tax=Achroia grisella TaxID=688607 RepID=UPI0027D24FD2|nr:carcinine transporter-like [Achroia grisella]
MESLRNDKESFNIGSNKDEAIPTKTSNDVEVKEVTYDELLSSAGEFGRYQILLFFSTFPFYVFGAMSYYSQLFMTEVSPNHWCWIPELLNLSSEDRRALAIPLDNRTHFGYSQCTAYVANWTEILITGQTPNETWDTVKCQHGWEFNKSEIPYPTISSELGWVCDKNSYQATAQAIFFLGSITGGFIIGWISDKYGRIPAVVISNLVGCIGGAVSVFARDFIEFSIYRFFMGMSYDNCMMMAYLIVLEYVAPKYRTFVSYMAFALLYSIAATTLPWIILLCGHWKTIALVTSLPMALAIFTPCFIPESPRWLLSKGRIEDAVKKVIEIGRVNKKEIPPATIETFKETACNAKLEENVSCLELLRRPLLRRMLIFICLTYVCCTIVFDGLVRGIKQLEFDYFITFSIVSFTEFPSMLIAAFIGEKMGRRWMTSLFLFVSCVCSILTVITGGWLSTLFAVAARFAVNMSGSATTLWTAELMPVSVRGFGASIAHICSYVATVISPYIIYLEIYIYWLPYVVIGCVAGFGGVIALTLPETVRKEMPQTFEDAEELMRSIQFCDIPCTSKKKSVDGIINECFEIK